MCLTQFLGVQGKKEKKISYLLQQKQKYCHSAFTFSYKAERRAEKRSYTAESEIPGLSNSM